MLTPGVIESTNPSSQRVAPLEHVVHPEGHVAQRFTRQRVAPLEHVVCPKGHVARQKKIKESGTLGARSASCRARRFEDDDETT